MSMTIIVTRNLPGRFHGFLASCLLEVAPGVYATPRLRKAVRERLWTVMSNWQSEIPDDGGLLLVYPDKSAPSRIGMVSLGWPKRDFIDLDGIWLAASPLTAANDLAELNELRDALVTPEISDHQPDDELDDFDPA